MEVTPTEQVRKTITGSLRYERKGHGYTQDELSKAIGRDKSTVNGWEGNGGSITLTDAWRIADLYSEGGEFVSLDQLAGRAAPQAVA